MRTELIVSRLGGREKRERLRSIREKVTVPITAIHFPKISKWLPTRVVYLYYIVTTVIIMLGIHHSGREPPKCEARKTGSVSEHAPHE